MRNYIRKTNRGNWDEVQMKNAIESVKRKETSIRKAAKSFGVPLESLRRRCNGTMKQFSADQQYKKQLGPIRTVLTEEQEIELEAYVVAMDNSFYGLSINELRKVTYEYCERKKIKHPFNKTNQMAGRDFVSGFLKRRKSLSLRKPEGVSLNRVFGLNRTSVQGYFNNLETVMNKYNFRPYRIYNVDESGLTCVHKPVKVLAPKGKRVVATATSGERGITTTVVTCCNATGNYIPPMMVFKRKRRKDDLTEHAPAGTLNEVSDSGWINSELFMTYLKHFAKHAKPTKDDRVLLILDGHKSHTKNIELIDYARESGIEILSLPPHTSHKLQPLDRTFFKPLKVAFNTACTSWMRLHPARRITIDKIGGLFNTAYLKAATIENAVSGFRCTGIVPLNNSILPETEFLSDPREDALEPSREDVLEPTKADVLEPTKANESLVEDTTIQTTENSSDDITIETSPVNTPGPSNITFCDILKVPDIIEKKKSKRSEESEIITSSPYKELLEKSISERTNSQKPTSTKKSKRAAKDVESKTVAKKSKLKVKKKTLSKSLPNNEDCACLVCGDWWHDSSAGEKWNQCTKCSAWVHELCCSSDGLVCDVCE